MNLKTFVYESIKYGRCNELINRNWCKEILEKILNFFNKCRFVN